jgi:hypothetical protein
VHDVAHPELVGGVVAEAPSVLARGRVDRTRHQAVATEQPVDGRRREREIRGDALLRAGGGDLAELYLWVVERAPRQGAAWFNGLERAVLSLDHHPERCPVAPESIDPDHPVRVLRYGRKPQRVPRLLHGRPQCTGRARGACEARSQATARCGRVDGRVSVSSVSYFAAYPAPRTCTSRLAVACASPGTFSCGLTPYGRGRDETGGARHSQSRNAVPVAASSR